MSRSLLLQMLHCRVLCCRRATTRPRLHNIRSSTRTTYPFCGVATSVKARSTPHRDLVLPSSNLVPRPIRSFSSSSPSLSASASTSGCMKHLEDSSSSSAYSNDKYLIPTLSVSIKCKGDIAEELMEALMSFGASSVSVEDGCSGDQAQEEISTAGPVPWDNNHRQLWKQCELIALFPPGQDVEESLVFAFDSIGLKEILPYKIESVKHQHWEQQVKDLFQPLSISDGFWIIPIWSNPPDPSAINLLLDPGLAFGTGDHPTTQLCVRWLIQTVKGGEDVLDYGTGSGILAISALKLGAGHAVGVDIDPIAVSSAQHNASLNGFVSPLLEVFIAPNPDDSPEGMGATKYDIVVANLLLNPLLQLSCNLINYTKPWGYICLSGILESQMDQILEKFAVHLESIEIKTQDGWACISGRKKSSS